MRKVIHEFNDIGLEALVPAWGGGRPKVITDEIRARIVEVVGSRPQELGEPYMTWSLSHLRSYLIRNGLVKAISKERLRVIFLEEGHTTQSTKGWKHSPDPEFSTKAARAVPAVRRGRVRTPGRGAGVFRRHGPVTPTPKGGKGWWKRGRPGRIRATPKAPRGGPLLRRL